MNIIDSVVNAIIQTIISIKNGDILVFLPGK